MRLRMKRQLPSEDGQWVDKRTVGSRRDRGLVCRPYDTSGRLEYTYRQRRGASDTLHRPLVCPRCGFKCPHQGALVNHMNSPDLSVCRWRRCRVVFDEMKAKQEIDMIDSGGRFLSGWDHFNLDDFKLWCRYTKRSKPERLSLQDADTPYKPSFQVLQPHFTLM